MTFIPNIYSTILLASGLITLLLCINIFRRYEVVVRWFGFMVLAIAVWALSYGFELATTNLREMLFWINLEYLGISFLPACWFFFIVKFTGKDEWITTRNYVHDDLCPGYCKRRGKPFGGLLSLCNALHPAIQSYTAPPMAAIAIL